MKLLIPILAVFGLLVYFQVPALKKQGYTRDLAVFWILTGIAFTLTVLQALGIEIPSPMKPIRYLVEDVLGLKY